jgi:hypothetical protein
MYVALFEMSSWMGPEQHIVRGSSAAELLYEFEEIQHLGCLVRMGRSEEGAEGQKMLDKLEEILYKRDSGDLTNEDLLTLDIKISLGTIKCVEIAEGDNAAEQLKAKYPNAR